MANSEKARNAAFAALAVCAAFVWPVAIEFLLKASLGSLWIRAAVVAVGPASAAIATCVWIGRRRREDAAAARFLLALCSADVNELGSNDRPAPVTASAVGRRWAAMLEEVRRRFGEHGLRIRDLQQSRAAVEIRGSKAVAQAEQIKDILSALPEPILAVDAFDDLTLLNASAERLLGIESRPTEVRAAKSLVRCQKLVDLLLGTSHHHSTGTRSEEIEVLDAAGHASHFRATAARLGAADEADENESGGAVVVLRNIVDQKALQKHNAEFVSAVSHEMKTPLAGIKAYVELLADGEAEDEATREEFLAVIDGQADRLQRLVENLLNLARIEAGVVKVSKEPRSLNSILEEALHVVQPSAESKSIHLTSDLSPLYLPVLADRDMLLQAAINLLSNAIKYTPAGGQVTLRSRMESGHVRFEVQDTGVGLSPDDCRRVFEKFYRVDKNKSMASGTGLGLALVKHIVEDVHGGKIAVESTPGAGSKFSVTLKMKD